MVVVAASQIFLVDGIGSIGVQFAQDALFGTNRAAFLKVIRVL
jgi:hypothetical protein